MRALFKLNCRLQALIKSCDSGNFASFSDAPTGDARASLAKRDALFDARATLYIDAFCRRKQQFGDCVIRVRRVFNRLQIASPPKADSSFDAFCFNCRATSFCSERQDFCARRSLFRLCLLQFSFKFRELRQIAQLANSETNLRKHEKRVKTLLCFQQS